MAREIVGYYYDEEKKRFFPTRGPIPGSSRKRKSESSSSADKSQKPALESDQARRTQSWMKSRSKILQFRELCGNIIPSRKGKFNFQTTCQNKQASQPLIWKYGQTQKKVDNVVQQMNIDIDTPAGTLETDILLAGGLNGTLSLFLVGNVEQVFDYEIECSPEPVWPVNKVQQTERIAPPNLCMPVHASIFMGSDITCIKMLRMPVDGALTRNVLITTMGSGASRGVAYIMDVTAPLGYYSSTSESLRRLASFESTIWDADCSYNGDKVAIGANRGAFLVNVESRVASQVLHCKSDVLSLQLDNPGNIILCGLRNGAILTVDARQKCQDFASQHRNPNAHHDSSRPKLQRNVHYPPKISMPSSIACLKSLMLYDQYFLASSMDGSIKLYDQRLIQKGAVQSYEGYVNSHTRIQLGVDPTERFVMSGGEDCKMRLWSIKSGEMLFENRFMSSVPSVVCWAKPADLARTPGELQDDQDYWQKHEWGVWIGSREGLFYMDWC
ncbi:uncharacterized protein [Coffea arabica]|uniref:Uncharacterized protein isoform X1 n=1 Tax=Coffea arabica TaxID=13443 RepID=A0A6P6UIA2_COFAR|nr:DDB1- and CUL4-associated factor 4-like isoform X1 [Coffea arabica]